MSMPDGQTTSTSTTTIDDVSTIDDQLRVGEGRDGTRAQGVNDNCKKDRHQINPLVIHFFSLLLAVNFLAAM